MQDISAIIAKELNVKEEYVSNVIALLDEGSTVPFIARYRKEVHGSMDDTALRTLEDRLHYLRSLEERRQAILKAIDAQGKLTPELEGAIENAATLAEIEDLYLPYKQKRRTRATVARERGLDPLAELLLEQRPDGPAPEEAAEDYVNQEQGVEDVSAALAGASDILAERFSDDADLRKTLRALLQRSGVLRCAAATEDDSVYRMYYDFASPLDRLKGHQVLAINRGEREGMLKVTVEPDSERSLQAMRRHILIPARPGRDFLNAAIADAWERLLFPSLEREARSTLSESAAEGAIGQFALNLRPLLMQPPVKGHVTMGLDPGYAHGCKVAVIDATGKVLATTVVYPTQGERRREEAISALGRLAEKHRVEHLAIGNGTASRETEQMASELIRREKAKGLSMSYMIVNEAGASVYSASPEGAAEFPEYDVNLRSAISIARRLQDPLAELVKIEPKAIGVGQYQHDCPQKRLEETLGNVVEDCVNAVGVDVNTASAALLRRVSGLTAATAKNIVARRESEGPFASRAELKKVKGLGPKAYQLSAGFLRIPESRNPLDNTAVHPESYDAAKALLALTGHKLADCAKGIADIDAAIRSIGAERAAEACGVGVPTLMDVAAELKKPGRDIRDELPKPILRTDVMDLKDLKPGMLLTGTVRNVIDFGVFVDIGVHQDGLVHISQVADHYIRHPSEVVAVGDQVQVKVLEVDEKRKRISLTMKV